ncbi:MAG TPA: cytochrome c [Albitalea sp.]|nr:cytochrome c [Albitalea sp.]
MTHPRSAFGAPPQGGAASGPAKPDPRRPLDALGSVVLLLTVAAIGTQAFAAPPELASPSNERQRALVHVVRQDCGSCHGMRLTGGLGPPLTREALADRPLPSLVATVLHGRPGTPMPGWQTMLSESDALWIAQQLQAGFPAEAKGNP